MLILESAVYPRVKAAASINSHCKADNTFGLLRYHEQLGMSARGSYAVLSRALGRCFVVMTSRGEQGAVVHSFLLRYFHFNASSLDQLLLAPASHAVLQLCLALPKRCYDSPLEFRRSTCRVALCTLHKFIARVGRQTRGRTHTT